MQLTWLAEFSCLKNQVGLALEHLSHWKACRPLPGTAAAALAQVSTKQRSRAYSATCNSEYTLHFMFILWSIFSLIHGLPCAEVFAGAGHDKSNLKSERV